MIITQDVSHEFSAADKVEAVKLAFFCSIQKGNIDFMKKYFREYAKHLKGEHKKWENHPEVFDPFKNGYDLLMHALLFGQQNVYNFFLKQFSDMVVTKENKEYLIKLLKDIHNGDQRIKESSRTMVSSLQKKGVQEVYAVAAVMTSGEGKKVHAAIGKQPVLLNHPKGHQVLERKPSVSDGSASTAFFSFETEGMKREPILHSGPPKQSVLKKQ